jgi:CP family cyanate transporter-like MFS transporter
MQSSAVDGGDERTLARLAVPVVLLWFAGIGLRLTILAVPPVIPRIHDDLGMSETGVGILSGLPPVLFALAAVPGSLLIARLGALPTLVAGLLITAIGSALRGAVPDVLTLYAATIVTGFGVAVMQPSLPPLVRAWMPTRIGFGTAVYANGLLVGETLAVALMIPLVLPLVGGSWRLGFAAWALPCIAIAAVIALLAPRPTAARNAAAPQRWWPDWNNSLIWRLGLTFGGVNAMYFALNAFIPEYLHQIDRGDLISASLSALNIGQLPASLILLVVSGRLVRHAWPYVLCGLLCAAAILGIMFGNAVVIVGSAALIGFADAAVLVLILALPPLLSEPDDVHRMSAGMFTISYSCAVILPIVTGLAWDVSGSAATAFAMIGLSIVPLLAVAPSVIARLREDL